MDKDKYILEISGEIITDIELDRLSISKLIYKSSRLARLVSSEKSQKWLSYEMNGYTSADELSLKYMTLTKRWINKDEKKGYWQAISIYENAIEITRANLNRITMPDLSGDRALLVLKNVNSQISALTKELMTYEKIVSSVKSILYKFVSDIYYEKKFANLAESIFDNYKKDVDSLIVDKCGIELLTKIPIVMERLSSEGSGESISQALLTVRRIIDAFADSIFPASDDTYEIETGTNLKLDQSKHLNRINVFVTQRLNSKSRRQKIRQNLANLYDRVSSGVHHDVDIEEAKSLFLNTYLLLGEILHISKNDIL